MPLGLSDNLFKRIISAVLLLPVVLWPIYEGGLWFAGLVMLAGALMIHEWCGLTQVKGIAPKALAIAAIATIVGTLVFADKGIGGQTLVLLVAMACLGGFMVKLKPQVGWWFTGVGYVGLPLVALLMLRDLSGLLVLWVFLVVWATDVGGYFAGKGIGGPKLAPRISPKKTWAGLLGGMALSAVVSIAMAKIVGFSETNWLMAALLAPWAQVGDLLESGIKRSFNVKDSGGLIPGHGGLLDRVDGLVFVAPVVAGLLYIMPLFGFEF